MYQQTEITQLEGRPIGDKTNVITVGPRGPLVVQDTVFIEEIAHFDRERIPERVVHAKGGGAHGKNIFWWYQLNGDSLGYFEVTKPDIKKYCKAAIFCE